MSAVNKNIAPFHYNLRLALLIIAVLGIIILGGAITRSYALTGPDCIVCHDGNAPTGEPYLNLRGNPDDRYDPQNEPDGTMKNEHHYFPFILGNRSCGSCHDGNKVIDSANNDLGRVFGICVNCHYTGNAILRSLDLTAAHAPKHNMTDVPQDLCLDCHAGNVWDEHFSHDIFVDAEGDLKCALCHISFDDPNFDPEFHPNVLDQIDFGSGESGQMIYCDDCHVDMKGGHQCLTCHQNSVGTRAAIGDMFSGNSHHVQRTDGSIENTDCYQCHWEADASGNMSNYHEMTANAPVDLVIFGGASRPDIYNLISTETSASTAIAYSADGSRTQIESLNAHCLGCHDEDTKGIDVFSDGKTPDHYAWDGNSVGIKFADTGTTTWGKYTTKGTKKNQIKAFSAHGNATINQGGGIPDTWISTREGTINVACFDCHNSHGSTVSGTTTSYTSATTNGGLLKSTTAGKGGYTMDYTPEYTSSLKGKYTFNSGAALCNDCHQNASSGTLPWGFNETFGATEEILPYLNSLNFGSSDGRVTHSGGHFGVSYPLTKTPQNPINNLCTPCHDPHGVSKTLNQAYAVPLLKGTWLTSGYRQDNPPPVNTTMTSAGFFFDQNTFATTTYDPTTGYYTTETSFISETETEFAGLCLNCHTKSDIDPDDPVDNATWKTMDRVHDAVKDWGINTQHNYSCSKCHTPHASGRLPRLMRSNCMDYRHKGQVGYQTYPILDGTGGAFPSYYGGCHGSNNSYAPVASSYVKEQYWNVVTRWEDRDDDDSVVYPDNPGLDGEDCDDYNDTIYRAIDGTCNGDGDAFLDASAGGKDCDDTDPNIGYETALCDQDNDGFIDWNAGGYDCDDLDPFVTVSADGFCK